MFREINLVTIKWAFVKTLPNVMHIIFFWPATSLGLCVIFLKCSKAFQHFGKCYLSAQSSGGWCNIWNCVYSWNLLSMLVLTTALSLQVFSRSPGLLTEVYHWHICGSYYVDSFSDSFCKSDTLFQVVLVALWFSAPLLHLSQMQEQSLCWTSED